MKPHPINPHRLRYIPAQFSWIDHRLIRQGYLQRCDHAALSLYLFYLTVADAQGMSYYADPRTMMMCSMTQRELNGARQCLVTQHLIAYAKPFIQVLSLDDVTGANETLTKRPPVKSLVKKHTEKRPSTQTMLTVNKARSRAWIAKLRLPLRTSP